MIVTSLKEALVKRDESSSVGMSSAIRTMTMKLTKPAKVPTKACNMSLETYIKQLKTWAEINEDVPEYVKYQDFKESLKTNKDITGLPGFVAEHVLPVLEKKTDKTVIRFKCKDCDQIKKNCDQIKKLIIEKRDVKKVNEVNVEVPPTADVNLCEEKVKVEQEMVINHTYKDKVRQMVILDIGAPVSIAGISCMTKYLEEFDLTIKEMKSIKCQQPF